MSAFTYDLTSTDTDAHVTVCGELDVLAAPELLRLLDAVCDAGRHVVVDLRPAEFIDSTGFSALVRAHRRFGERLTFLGPQGPAARALELVGLDALVPFVDATTQQPRTR